MCVIAPATPGHVVFHSPELKRAFCWRRSLCRINRAERIFRQGDHQTLISSIQQRLWPMGDDTVFIRGMGQRARSDANAR